MEAAGAAAPGVVPPDNTVEFFYRERRFVQGTCVGVLDAIIVHMHDIHTASNICP